MYIIISVVISYLLGFFASARVYSSLIICGGSGDREENIHWVIQQSAKSGGDKKGPAFREAVF